MNVIDEFNRLKYHFFDDWKSIVHLVYGMSIVAVYHYVLSYLVIAMVLVYGFILYQLFESRKKYEILGDISEMFVGIFIMIILIMILNWGVIV